MQGNPDLVDLPGSVLISAVTLAGNTLATLAMLPSDRIALLQGHIAMAGGPFIEHQQLLWEGTVIAGDSVVSDLGIPAGTSASLTLVVDSARAYVWGHAGEGSALQDDSAAFKKTSPHPLTCGARSALPLPHNARWQVQFKLAGTHWSVGVVAQEPPLESSTYCCLYSTASDRGWVLLFDDEGVFSCGVGEKRKLHGLRCTTGHEMSLCFRLTEGRLLSVLFEGEEEERVLFQDLPSDSKLHAAVSTTLTGGAARISHVPL